MSSPISGFQSCNLLDPLSYYYIQLSGTAQGVEVAQVLEHGVELGLLKSGTSTINANGWLVETVDKNGVSVFCTTGDYIVIGANQEGQLASVALYAGPNSPYTETPQFSKFMKTT